MNKLTSLGCLIAAAFSWEACASTPRSFDFRYARFGSYYTIPVTDSNAGDARLWLADPSQPAEGLIVFNDLGKSRANIRGYQQVAAAMRFGLIGTESGFQGLEARFTRQTIDSMLSAAASATGRQELTKAPLAYIGFSGGGNDAALSSQHAPDRAIAYVSNRFALPPHEDAQPGWQEVPGLILAGAADNNQRPSELFEFAIRGSGPLAGIATREKGGLAALGVLRGYAHSDDSGDNPAGPGYEMAMYWIAQAAKHRVPANWPATGQAPVLRDFAEEQGWLAETDRYVTATGGGLDTPGGTSPFKTIGSVATYTGDPSTASWMMDADTAQAFRAVASTDLGSRGIYPQNSPLVISSIAPLASFNEGDSVSIVVNPRDFDDSVALTRMEFYDGAQLLGTDTSAADGWSLGVALTSPGVRALNVIGRRADGQARAALRVVSVQPIPEPGGLVLLAAASSVPLSRRRRIGKVRRSVGRS